MGSLSFYPELEGIAKTSSLFIKVAKVNGSNPDAGRKLLSYALKAGFKRSGIKSTTSTGCFSSAEDGSWWGIMWANRLLNSSFRAKALESGYATLEDLQRYADDWREWSSLEDAIWTNINLEIVCQVE